MGADHPATSLPGWHPSESGYVPPAIVNRQRPRRGVCHYGFYSVSCPAHGQCIEGEAENCGSAPPGDPGNRGSPVAGPAASAAGCPRDRPGPPGRGPAPGLHPRGGGRRGRHRVLRRAAGAGRRGRGRRWSAGRIVAVAGAGGRSVRARAGALRDRGRAAAGRFGAAPTGRHVVGHGGGAPLPRAGGGGGRSGSHRPDGGTAVDARRRGDGRAGVGAVARGRAAAAGWGGGGGGGQPLAGDGRPGHGGWRGRGRAEVARRVVALPGWKAGGVDRGVGGGRLDTRGSPGAAPQWMWRQGAETHAVSERWQPSRRTGP